MILPDVNVLLYAFREDTPEHAASLEWLDTVVNGNAAPGVCPQVPASFVPIATHWRVYIPPSPLEEALGFCDFLLGQPQAQVVAPGPRHWDIYRELCRKAKATGSLTQDAWFAAIAIESGCEWS